jgi:hypothetical protein
MRELTLWTVGAMFGKELPQLGKRSLCPIRQHKRRDKGFKVFSSRSGDLLYKCFSCDPPQNVGDAVALYAVLANVDRLEAWKTLRDDGYQVPGLDERFATRRQSRSSPPPRKVTPVRGDLSQGDPVLPLDMQFWHDATLRRAGDVERLGSERGLDVQLLRDHDVVDMDAGCVGFGYRDPATHLPCRIKVRALYRKAFWMEPRPAEGERGKALAPLYLAHRLRIPRGGFGLTVVITEGELDALSLKQAGFDNVVSLPDGAESAGRVDLRPLMGGFPVWLAATDNDEKGQRAARELASRAAQVQCKSAPVIWRLGDRVFKDANEAWMAGMRHDELLACLNQAAEDALGYQVNVA